MIKILPKIADTKCPINKKIMLRNLRALVSIGILLPLFSYSQQRWTVKPLPVTTKWTNVVTPSNVLNEYPRPQLKRSNWKNLNGLWKYAIADSGSTAGGDFRNEILVPFPVESALSGVQKALTPDSALWYKRAFSYKAVGKGKRVLLNFGAVDQYAEVYVNKKMVGKHEGGYQSFSFDITNALLAGENELLVKVLDPTDAGYAPKGKQTLMPSGMYYTATSGIWQTVWLEEVPVVSISSLKMIPDIDQQTLHLTVSSNVELTNDYTITARIPGQVVTGDGSGMDVRLRNAHLWSPEDPFLYDMRVSLLYKGKVIDSVDTYFGMRKIAVKNDEKGIARIFLNNKPYFNLGVLDQGFWPDGIYTAPTDEALAFDVKAIKSLGFNTIRKHIKVEPDRWYYHCDKLGVLVWQDMVNPPIPFGNAQQEFEKETAENIAMLYNHPSIAVWVVFNEGWGAYDQERVTKWVKKVDPTRLVNGHTGENYYQDSPKDVLLKWAGSDMTDIHAYPDPQMPPSLPGKARVLGEFGGVGAMVTGHQWNDLSGWGYITVGLDSLAKTYQQMMVNVKGMEEQGLSGSIYTQPFDVEGEQNGLITYDRRILKVPQKLLVAENNHVAGVKLTPLALKELSQPANEGDILNALKKRFATGNYDTVSLRQLAILSIRTGDTILAQKVVEKYISMVPNPGTVENLHFLGKLTNSMNDPGFSYLIKYSHVMKDEPRLASVMENTKEKIVEKVLNPALVGVHELRQWDSVKAVISQQYGDFVEEVVERYEMLTLQGQKRWKEFSIVAIPYLKKYAANMDPTALNSFAYDVFLHVNDSTVISNAMGWAEMAMSRLRDPNIFDTYASLLYKVGRREEALKVQIVAVKMAPEEKVFEENYEKMKNGTLLWD